MNRLPSQNKIFDTHQHPEFRGDRRPHFNRVAVEYVGNESNSGPYLVGEKTGKRYGVGADPIFQGHVGGGLRGNFWVSEDVIHDVRP